MATTSYILPTAVTYNGPGVSGWLDPSNILLVDNKFTTSSGATSVLMVGNFNLNLAQGNDITNFTVRIKGYRGSFNTTLNIYAVDNTTGVELSYPMAPFQSFSGTNTLFTLPSTLFGTTWTVDQANNIQLKLISDGELHIDAVELSADYVPQVTPVPITPSTGQVVVDEFVQSIRFQLASSITDTDLFCFTKSFTLPDGTPIQYPDFHGEALIVLDQGVPFLEENIRITNIEHNYQGTNLTRISFGNITNRGLKFIYPYDHDINLCKPHDGTAEFVISNSAPFYNRFLRKNQINALVSAPIYVQDESVQLADPVHTLDFKGPGVSVVNDGVDSFKKIITIPGNGINPPSVYSTSSATSGASQVSSLQWQHTSGGLDRTLIVQVSTETASTVSSITYNGVALTQSVSDTNGTVRNEQWHLVAPPIGTYNIVVTLSAPAYLTCGAETYNTTDQSSPIGVTQTSDGSSLTPSLVLTTSTNNSIVVDSLATGTLPIVYTAGAAQSENWHITVNPNARQGASSVESAGSAPDAVTMSWAITQSTPWVMTALELKGVSSAITGVQTVTGLNTDNTDPVNPIVKISVDGSTITGLGTPGSPLVATAGAGASVVKATSADTTPSYLDNKLNIHSTDGSVIVTKTITNPAGNEVVDYDLSVPVGTGGIVNTKTAISIFQDFNGNQINSSGGGTNITYGGLYPFITITSGTTTALIANHPGVVEFGSSGNLELGFDLVGLDASDFSLEGMFYFDAVLPSSLNILMNSSFGGSTNYFAMQLLKASSQYSVNGSSLASCTYLTGWNTFKVLYNSAGTSASFYLNGTLVGSSLPVSLAGSAPTSTSGVYSKLDYLSVNATITR